MQLPLIALKVFLRRKLLNYSLCCMIVDFTFANVAENNLSLSAQLFRRSNDFKSELFIYTRTF